MMVREIVARRVQYLAADHICAGEAWTELLGTLFQLSQSPEAGKREVAFRIFSATPGVIEKQHEDAVQGVFAQGFKDTNAEVRIG